MSSGVGTMVRGQGSGCSLYRHAVDPSTEGRVGTQEQTAWSHSSLVCLRPPFTNQQCLLCPPEMSHPHLPSSGQSTQEKVHGQIDMAFPQPRLALPTPPSILLGTITWPCRAGFYHLLWSDDLYPGLYSCSHVTCQTLNNTPQELLSLKASVQHPVGEKGW